MGQGAGLHLGWDHRAAPGMRLHAQRQRREAGIKARVDSGAMTGATADWSEAVGALDAAAAGTEALDAWQEGQSVLMAAHGSESVAWAVCRQYPSSPHVVQVKVLVFRFLSFHVVSFVPLNLVPWVLSVTGRRP